MSYEVVVTGGRRGAEQGVVDAALDAWAEAHGAIGCVVHGACPDPQRAGEGLSVDACADRWAKARGVDVHRFPVSAERWRREGTAAGPLRNGRMGDQLLLRRLGAGKKAPARPVAVLAFPGGRGTESMCRAAVDRRIPLFRAAVDDGCWEPAWHPWLKQPSSFIVQGAVSLRVETAVSLLRGKVTALGPLTLPPPGVEECGKHQRAPIAPDRLVALHCRRREVHGGSSVVEQKLRFALRGQIFAVAELGEQGSITGLWPIPGVPDRGQPAPWRLSPAVSAPLLGHVGRLSRRARAERKGAQDPERTETSV